ncbi:MULTISPECIES: hypothetical protein [Pseudomonas]|uniref:hypothetical protein n=1 Tax=Pseudomonas mosselii TaxID=78327 RepID=UPI003D64A3F4
MNKQSLERLIQGFASLLNGLSLRNWTAYREALWKAVANDPFLSAQFGSVSLEKMKRGRPPFRPRA